MSGRIDERCCDDDKVITEHEARVVSSGLTKKKKEDLFDESMYDEYLESGGNNGSG